MRFVEITRQIGAERDEIEIDVPTTTSQDAMVKVTIRRIEKNPEFGNVRPGDPAAAFVRPTITDESTIEIQRATWDNLVAALATQKAKAK